MEAQSSARSMPRNMVAGLSGVVFGIGLGISQMVNPDKVLDFLDLFGTWDPSLALVMGVAVALYFVTWRVALTRRTPILDARFHWPDPGTMWDARLVGGAVLFGIGWGLVGFCPGPALTSLAYLLPQSAVFVVAMVAGSYAAGFTRPGRIKLEEAPATS